MKILGTGMYPKQTFELKITFSSEYSVEERMATKDLLIDWLHANDVDSFVEGVIDDLDIDHEFGLGDRDFYDDLDGGLSPVSLFKYSREYLVDLQSKIDVRFAKAVHCTLHSQETSVWMDGWKESFKPVSAERFYIYPPWEPCLARADQVKILIEPGMAFGTGQHATTILCLELFEELLSRNRFDISTSHVCDVGTGTGILAIAAVKLGAASVLATDIDPDAIRAATQNATDNAISFATRLTSVPVDGEQKFHLIFANILAVVLKKLAKDLASVCQEGGLVIMSGLLDEQRDELLRICEAADLHLETLRLKDDWCGLVLRKGRGGR